MNSVQLASALRGAFLAQFPNGYFNVSKLALGGGLCVSCGLIKNIEDQTSKIRDNDPLEILIFFHGTIYNSEQDQPTVTYEFGKSRLMTLPTEKYMAMGSIKIASRKGDTTPEKAVQALTKYFQKVKATVDEAKTAGTIYGQDRIPAMYL